MATKTSPKKTNDELRIWFIIAYVLSIFSGIVVLFLKGSEDQRLKMHSVQAILLGLLMIGIAIVFGILSYAVSILSLLGALINAFLWLYGIYVGFKAHEDIDIVIPEITAYAKRYSGTK
jgi:uncharacterized membrane protein